MLWSDPGGYDAYSAEPRFGSASGSQPPKGLRYEPGRVLKLSSGSLRRLIEADSRDLSALRQVVDLFVLHYDACGTSRTCFEVLHDRRGLSVHFMLDLDGTIYQTLDLRDQAWHAGPANTRSVGIEIANIGAYAASEAGLLDEWYTADSKGVRVRLPAGLGDGGLRRPNFVARPARVSRQRGRIHGALYEQYDLTPEQYDSLVELTASLLEIFPRMQADAPRSAAGRISGDALGMAELGHFRGILGHYHLTQRKRDPGPAFDWEGFLERVAKRLRAAAASAAPGS